MALLKFLLATLEYSTVSAILLGVTLPRMEVKRNMPKNSGLRAGVVSMRIEKKTMAQMHLLAPGSVGEVSAEDRAEEHTHVGRVAERPCHEGVRPRGLYLMSAGALTP